MGKLIHLIHGVSIGTGMAFATSCFTMAGMLVGTLGEQAPRAVAIAAVLILVVAYAVGRMARRFPSAMGIRTYTKAAFGNGASLFVVFSYLLMIGLIGGIESVIFAKIVTHYLPAIPAGVIIVGLVTLTALFNLLGMQGSRVIQSVMTWTLIAGIGVLCAAALNMPFSGATLAMTPALEAWPAGIVGAFFLFVGFEWVASVQSGSRDAAAVLPPALALSVLVLAGCYIFITLAFAHVLPSSSFDGQALPQLSLAEALWGRQGVLAALILSALSALTSFNAGMMGASRMLYALARERCLPPSLLHTHPRSAAPTVAIAVISALTIVIAATLWTTGFIVLAGNFAAILICICYLALLAAFLKLETTGHPRHASKAGVIGAGVVLLLTAAFLLALIIDSHARMTLLAALGCLLPVAWYCRRLARSLATA